MIQPIKHFAVNWIDGMKISQKHFDAQENYMIDIVRDSSSLFINNFNYGLLPTSGHGERAIFDVYNTATNDVQLVIKNCSAVTAAGYRIELSDYNTNVKSLAAPIQQEQSVDEEYYILITVNPFDKIAIGDLDPEETPPRRPNTQAKYYIELLPSSSIGTIQNGGNYIVIGRVNLKNNIAQADQNFIPPCTSVHSHPALLNYYGGFAKAMGNLQQYAFKIIQKTSNISQNTNLARNVKLLCNTLINHLANVYFYYRNIVPQQPPVYLIDVFSRQALHLYNATQSMLPSELEEMLNYIFEWSEVAPHTLLNQLSAVTEINYDHNNCGAHLLEIQSLLRSLEAILSKLSELDYIGQRKENIIVNEQNIRPAAKTKRGWSVLD